MASIFDSLSVADVTALKALTSTTAPRRADKVFLVVRDDSTGYPAGYLYSLTATDTEDLPAIVAPTDNVGRWFQFKGGATGGGDPTVVMTTSTLSPASAPPTQSPSSGVLYIHLQIDGSGSGISLKYWVGIDSTGAEGDNGWMFNDQFFRF